MKEPKVPQEVLELYRARGAEGLISAINRPSVLSNPTQLAAAQLQILELAIFHCDEALLTGYVETLPRLKYGARYNEARRVCARLLKDPSRVALLKCFMDACQLDPSAHVELDASPLKIAARSKNPGAVQYLVERGAELEWRDSEHFNALDYAIGAEDPVSAFYLLEHATAKMITRTYSGGTYSPALIMFALVPDAGFTRDVRKALLQKLVELGAPLNGYGPPLFRPPLHLALMEEGGRISCKESLHALVQAGADLNPLTGLPGKTLRESMSPEESARLDLYLITQAVSEASGEPRLRL